MGSLEHTLKENGMVQVTLPEMFLFFLAQPPRVNPHYEKVRQESEAWLLKHGDFDSRVSRIIHRTDFSYFCAVVMPDASAETFPFDNGHLQKNPEEARKLIDGLVSIMRNENFEPEHPLLIAYKSIWLRLSQTSSKGVQNRFAASMTSYVEAVMQQVNLQSTAVLTSTIEGLVALRRDSIATTPIYALIEYAYGLELPDEVIKHPSIQKIETIATDMVLIQNDIVSYAKEKALGESHNIVSLYHLQGYSLQSSFDCAGELLKGRYRDWYQTLTELPTWGEEIDSQVQTYITSVQNVALANLNWR
ncbi:terpenoid synthase [Viridothelium virens]|uniref:Terpene synthase n=1 Tax=Viridothelium virens TaxID=1048519 RepID=A0A6A6HJH0_VIRVR|nr:terpenoid synthase [Viridothelium virens]